MAAKLPLMDQILRYFVTKIMLLVMQSNDSLEMQRPQIRWMRWIKAPRYSKAALPRYMSWRLK
ncbi:hypothetical protein AJ80_02322 [Polytolypa hystricis UAMH7299]|uniref:Uncharacterized protein n=1 Tax=Polytolypa hystricis (strain UAMH7299) TaxID=1447883 RepID=A0A2B7YRP6_POLH7|nr:hypothetical protein AJ80_02322 [Polytolypa hystricis UAMH7299]